MQFRIFMILFFLSSSLGIAKPDLGLDDDFINGVEYAKRLELDKAIGAFAKAREKYPNHPRLIYLIADCLVKLKRTQDALTLMEGYEQRKDSVVGGIVLLANIYNQIGRVRQAQKVIEIAMHRVKKIPATWYAFRGELLYQQRLLQMSLADFRRAIQRDEEVADFYYRIALVYADLKQPKKARANLKAAVKRDVFNGVYLYTLALSESELKNHSVAADLAAKAVKLEPNNALFYKAAGLLAWKANRKIKAIAFLQLADAIDPNDDDVKKYLSKLKSPPQKIGM